MIAFRMEEGVATVALVRFEQPQTHLEPKYSPDGEYLGKAPVTYPRAWMLRRQISCPGDVCN